MECEHLHSFTFPSATNLTAIVRVGWTSEKIFIWQRFHRLVDILNVWFTVHELPHEYGNDNENGTTIMFFRSVLYLLTCMVTTSKPWSRCTEFEQQFFKCDANDTIIVDATTAQWVFSLLTETPSCVFGAYFSNRMKTYKQVAIQTWSNLYYHAFPSEDYGIDLFLCNYYCRTNFGVWPVSYQTAHDLSNMKLISTKRIPTNEERIIMMNICNVHGSNAVNVLQSMVRRAKKINLCLKRKTLCVRFADDAQTQKRLCVAK